MMDRSQQWRPFTFPAVLGVHVFSWPITAPPARVSLPRACQSCQIAAGPGTRPTAAGLDVWFSGWYYDCTLYEVLLYIMKRIKSIHHGLSMKQGKILWDVLRYGEMWWNSITYSDIWWDIVRFCEIWSDSVRFYHIWWDLARFCDVHVQWDMVRIGEIQWDIVWFGVIQWDYERFGELW